MVVYWAKRIRMTTFGLPFFRIEKMLREKIMSWRPRFVTRWNRYLLLRFRSRRCIVKWSFLTCVVSSQGRLWDGLVPALFRCKSLLHFDWLVPSRSFFLRRSFRAAISIFEPARALHIQQSPATILIRTPGSLLCTNQTSDLEQG